MKWEKASWQSQITWLKIVIVTALLPTSLSSVRWTNRTIYSLLRFRTMLSVTIQIIWTWLRQCTSSISQARKQSCLPRIMVHSTKSRWALKTLRTPWTISAMARLNRTKFLTILQLRTWLSKCKWSIKILLKASLNKIPTFPFQITTRLWNKEQGLSLINLYLQPCQWEEGPSKARTKSQKEMEWPMRSLLTMLVQIDQVH